MNGVGFMGRDIGIEGLLPSDTTCVSLVMASGMRLSLQGFIQ